MKKILAFIIGGLLVASVCWATVVDQGTAELKVKTITTPQITDTASAGAFTADFSAGNVHYFALASGAQTVDFTTPASGGVYRIILKQPASGAAGTISSWDADILWGFGIVPTLTTTNSKVDIISCIYGPTATKYYCTPTLNF